MSELTFEAEFAKLLTVLKQITEETPGLHRKVCLYETAYNKTISSKHLEYFGPIYLQAADEIATETEYGSWLSSEDYSIVFGKRNTGAELNLSKIYAKAVVKAAQNPYPSPGHELVPIHPKIMLLHLYRIFTLVAPAERLISLKRRVAVLEQDLRGDNAAPANGLQGMQASLGPLLQMARETFAKGATPEQNKIMDSVMAMATSKELGNTISQLGNNMSELMSVGGKLLPQIMASAGDVRSGKSDVKTVLGNLLAEPEVTAQLGKLDGLKPLFSQAANMLEQQGIEMPAAITGDISQVPVSELVRNVLASPEAQKEISHFNKTATDLIRDPSKVEQLTQVGRSLAHSTGFNLPANFDANAFLGGSGTPGMPGMPGMGDYNQVAGLSQMGLNSVSNGNSVATSNSVANLSQTTPMTRPGPDLNSLQNALATLPPDQLAALMQQFSQQRLGK